VSTGSLKTVKFVAIPGQAGDIKLFPSNNPSADDFVHTVLGELRIEDGGELWVEDGVDLLVAENSSSCYLMVSGRVIYEV
jgi:hypothetical protein